MARAVVYGLETVQIHHKKAKGDVQPLKAVYGRFNLGFQVAPVGQLGKRVNKGHLLQILNALQRNLGFRVVGENLNGANHFALLVLQGSCADSNRNPVTLLVAGKNSGIPFIAARKGV
jgi:hypothetical protein